MHNDADNATGDALIHQARGRLSELSLESVLRLCIHYLTREPNDGYGWYERRPFITFLMIKWAAELWDPTHQRRVAKPSDFDFVVQSIWDVGADRKLTHLRR